MAEDAAPAEPEVLVERDGGILILTINRPHRSNALAPSTARLLAELVLEAGDDPEVRAIVFTGSGGRSFCAGMDLKAAAGAQNQGKRLKSSIRGGRRAMIEVVIETWKPTIAAIEGAAVGGGLELALACDLRVAGAGAKLGLPEAKRGLAAHYGTVLLPRVVPQAVAFEMLYLGQTISAERGEAVGLINRVTEPGQALAAALDLARQIAANAPVSLRRMKETVVKSSGLPLALALRLNEGMSPFDSEDRAEGIKAFNEGRTPVWKGR